MSDKPCTSQHGSCGYHRPGTVAHHGFHGANKAFFFHFSMPDDGQTTTNIYDPVNMPALWMLNAQIPRTLQYGNEECSCWTSGCGEFDIFEVLSPGETKCKSTLHGNKAGGDSNYFDRPTAGAIKVAVVMFENNMHVKVLDEEFDFGGEIDGGTIEEIVGSTSKASEFVSLFRLSGAGSG